MIELAITLVVFPLVGAAAALALRLPLPSARLAFFFLTGVGVHGALLYVFGVLRVPLVVATFAAIPSVALVVIVLLRGRRLRHPGAAKTAEGSQDARLSHSEILPPSSRLQDDGAKVLLAIPIVILFCAATAMPARDYDGRVTWLPKARAIALEHSIAGPFFHGERGLNLHNRYPLLLPLDAATVMALSGDTRNEAARWMYVLIPIAALLVLRSMLASRHGATGAWIAAAVAWLPVFTSIEGGSLAAYSDFALMAFAGVAVLALMDESPRVAGLFAAFCVLAKNEGAVLAGAIVVAAFFVRRVPWQVIVPVVAAEGLVVYWRTLVPAAYDEQYEVLVSALPRSLHRVPEALSAIAMHASQFAEWGVFWIAVVVASVVGFTKRLAIPLIVIVLAIAAYALALTVTSWSIADLAKVAVHRLLSHLIVPGACVLAAVLHRVERRA